MSPVLKVWCRSVKIPLRYLSFCWNLTKIAHFELIQATLVAKLAIVCHFELLWCEVIWKSWKTPKNCRCTSPRTKIFEISPKMRHFGGKKMGKVVNEVKLAIPSQSEPDFGGKDGKTCKMTKIGYFEPIQATFLTKFAIVGHLSHFSVKWFGKSWKLKKLPVHINRDSAEIFKFSISFDHSTALLGLILTSLEKWTLFWRFGADRSWFCWDIRVFISFDHSIALLGLILTGSEKWALFWRSVKILLRYLSFCWNLTKIAHFELIQATLVAKLAIMGHFEPLWCEMIWKSWKTENICWCTPPHGMKIFEISPKMRCFGGKRWEKLWIVWNWSFWVNLNLILGEKMEKPAKWPKLAIWSQSKPLFWQNLPYQSRFCWDI